jgi:anti-anti-sigma factor
VLGDVVIVEFSGNACLCNEDEAPAFIAHLLDQGFLKFLLDLRQVPYIDSLGLAGVVLAYTMVVRKGGTLKLVNAGKRIRDLVVMTKLSPLFEIFDSVDEALRSFDRSVSAPQ